jgi:hypothetical protein
MNSNRNYKASVFSDLFSSPAAIREVYGALSGHPVPPDEPVGVNTLSDVIFMEQVNDLSFTLGGRVVVVIEHQSSINPNMPLRLLLYIARLYEKLTESDAVYSSRALSIPRPEFYVLYNGTEEYPDREELRLSDLFSEKTGKPVLELTVPVYNINAGHNAEMLGKSETLEGYSIFIEKAREYEAERHDRSEGIREALEWCIRRGILAGYLRDRGSEVINMLLTEWNTEDAKRVWAREAREDGIKIGEQRGIKIGEQRSAATIAAKDAEIAALREQLALR